MKKSLPVFCALMLVPLLTLFAQGPSDRPAEESVKPGINEKFLDPNLKVADWLKRFEVESREVFHARDKILAACHIKPGMAVADVGAGTGLYTRLFSKAVGDEGWVYAVEINPRWLEHIRARARQENQENITTLLSEPDSVTLPPASVDRIFLCDTYHHFEFPMTTMATIVSALKPGGELVVVDFERIEGVTREWLMNHVRAGKPIVKKEIEDSGLEFVEEVKLEELEENYLIRFRKPKN